MSFSTKLVSSVALGVAIAAAGCGSGADPAPTDTETAQGPVTLRPDATTESTEAPETDDADTASPDDDAPEHADPAARAALAALVAVPGDVIAIDREDGGIWSVEVRTSAGDGVEVYVDGSTGDILRQRPESLPSEARDGAPAVTAVEAIDIVLAAAPGAVTRELDIGTERGVVVWEIEVRDGGGEIEFYVDASTGEILEQERD